jgi:hypothetical protein
MPQPTHHDANLILHLYEMRREEKLRAARAWFVANFKVKTMADFNLLCPPGSQENANARMVISYWDMAASFVTAGVINRELFFESGRELLVTWIRVKPIVAEARAAFKDPGVWRNLEQVGEAYAQHLGEQTFQAFAARIGD